jgi:hypothetical protein
LGFTCLAVVGCACFRRTLVGATVLFWGLCASTPDRNNATNQNRQPDRKHEIANAAPARSKFSHSSNELKYVLQFVTFSGFRLSFQVHCLELAACCELNDPISMGLSHHGNLGAMYKISQRFHSNFSQNGHDSEALKDRGSRRP